MHDIHRFFTSSISIKRQEDYPWSSHVNDLKELLKINSSRVDKLLDGLLHQGQWILEHHLQGFLVPTIVHESLKKFKNPGENLIITIPYKHMKKISIKSHPEYDGCDFKVVCNTVIYNISPPWEKISFVEIEYTHSPIKLTPVMYSTLLKIASILYLNEPTESIEKILQPLRYSVEHL